jgi:hypothetical protein
MTDNMPHGRATLERVRIDHRNLTATEVFHLSCALCGWHVAPRTPADRPPISAVVWLAAALSTGGRYQAPETPGHRAELHDGGPEVDSVILMAIVQRHFLPALEPAWDDEALAEQLGIDGRDIARSQLVLDAIRVLVPRSQAPLGPGWWTAAPTAGAPATEGNQER